MNLHHEPLFRILYHPLEYTHPNHLPAGWDKVEKGDEPLLNYWLHARYQLAHLPDDCRLHNNLTPLLLQHWQRLPLIAHLVGGYLLRTTLLRHGLMLFMDPQLMAFIALPLLHQVHFTGPAPGASQTQACGASFILSQCPTLPHALRQRFFLQFPASVELPTLSAPLIPDHINLFKMALNYANCYPSRTA